MYGDIGLQHCAANDVVVWNRARQSIAPSLDIPCQEAPMKVTSYCVIDESLLNLGFTTSLVFEHNIIIPSPLDLRIK